MNKITVFFIELSHLLPDHFRLQYTAISFCNKNNVVTWKIFYYVCMITAEIFPQPPFDGIPLCSLADFSRYDRPHPILASPIWKKKENKVSNLPA